MIVRRTAVQIVTKLSDYLKIDFVPKMCQNFDRWTENVVK